MSNLPNGFNCIYTKIIDLYNNPKLEVRNNIIEKIKNMPVGRRVLRYFGGNEGRGIGYNPDYFQFFVQLCKDAEVTEVVLRVEIDDFDSGYKHYKGFIDAGINVILIDFGNEEYFEVKPRNFFENLLWGAGWVRANANNSYANSYANKFKNFVSYMSGKGYDIKSKMSWCTHWLGDAGTIAWHNTLKSKLSEYKNCTLHLYGDVKDSDYFTKLKNLVAKNFKGLKLYVTEYQGLGFHRLTDQEKRAYYLSDDHFRMHREMTRVLDDLGVSLRLLHTLWHWDHYEGYYAVYWINEQTGSTQDKLTPILYQ